MLSRVSECKESLGVRTRAYVVSKRRLAFARLIEVVCELFGFDIGTRLRLERSGDLTMQLAPLAPE